MKQQILEKIKQAGVVGSGGAGLPTHVKADATVDTVLVNGASCEPLLMSDPYLMQQHSSMVISGLKTLMQCTGATSGIVCLKGKHKEAMAAMQAATAAEPNIKVFELKDFYPAGDEQVLVYEVLGRIVPERGLPLQVGAVVSNVESLYNIAKAMQNIPVTERYLTITGAVAKPMVVKAPVGTLVLDLINFAGGATIGNYRVVDGGPMMGKVLANTNQPITKTTSGLIVLPPEHTVIKSKIAKPEHLRRITTTICCQCTRCTDLCPRNLLGHSLHPHKLMRVLESVETSSPAALEALLCSECGLCEKFACPMGVSPREVNAQIKKRLMQQGISWQSSNKTYNPNPFRPTRHVSTGRLIQRLNLAGYQAHAAYAGVFTPATVTIPLRQHIGAAAQCIVKTGAKVQAGELIGKIPTEAMGANIHASISGVVEHVSDNAVTITSNTGNYR